jgi:hypothetical protein
MVPSATPDKYHLRARLIDAGLVRTFQGWQVNGHLDMVSLCQSPHKEHKRCCRPKAMLR